MRYVFISFMDSKNIGDLKIVDVLEEEFFRKDDNIDKFTFNLEKFNGAQELNSAYSVKKSSIKNFTFTFIKNVFNDYLRKYSIFDGLLTLRMKHKIKNNIIKSNLEDSIKKCDLIIVGGGNAIFDLTEKSDSVYKFEKIFELSNLYEKKVFVTSIGVGPFKTLKQLKRTQKVLSEASSITVRDEKSYNYLSNVDVPLSLSIDPVFVMKKYNIKDNVIKKKINIGICIIDLTLNKKTERHNNEYLKNMSKIIKKIDLNMFNVYLFSTELRDYRSIEILKSTYLKNEKIFYKNIFSFNDLIDFYSEIDLVIGTRMHSMIIAVSQEIPIIGISWQDKVLEMFNMINQKDIIDIDSLDDSTNEIIEMINNKISNISEEKKYLKELKNINEERFKVNLETLNNLSRK